LTKAALQTKPRLSMIEALVAASASLEIGDTVRRTDGPRIPAEVRGAAKATDEFSGRRALQNPGIENSSSCDWDVYPSSSLRRDSNAPQVRM
jgi:hypothetical protein